VSSFKRADGGRRDPFDYSFRVEITVCCARGHALLAFHRLTLPGREHEGVSYDEASLGKGATVTGEPPDDWRKIYLTCGHCGGRTTEVSRSRLEDMLAAMWAPYATGPQVRKRVIWDSPGRTRD
jgi:hypothetical protein